MQDMPNGFDTPMQGLSTPQWLEKLEDIAEEHGYFQTLGTNHFATFIEDKPTLVVTFETIKDIQARGDTSARRNRPWRIVAARRSDCGLDRNGPVRDVVAAFKW